MGTEGRTIQRRVPSSSEKNAVCRLWKGLNERGFSEISVEFAVQNGNVTIYYDTNARIGHQLVMSELPPRGSRWRVSGCVYVWYSALANLVEDGIFGGWLRIAE